MLLEEKESMSLGGTAAFSFLACINCWSVGWEHSLNFNERVFRLRQSVKRVGDNHWAPCTHEKVAPFGGRAYYFFLPRC
jgi:hypothetical protein